MSGLTIFMGPMFAQKTTTLISHLKKGSVKEETLCVNSKKDTRCEEEIKTHDGKSFIAKKVSSLLDLELDAEFLSAKIIGIDEIQFFCDDDDTSKKLFYNFFKKWTRTKMFYVSGLDGTSDQLPWSWLCIIPLADKVKKISAYCTKCPERVKAPFTRCKIHKDHIELIGGDDMYYPVCRKHIEE